MADPSTFTTKPGSRASAILALLAANPLVRYRAFEVARALGERTQPVANECARLARRGVVTRTDSEDPTIPTWYQHKSVGSP